MVKTKISTPEKTLETDTSVNEPVNKTKESEKTEPVQEDLSAETETKIETEKTKKSYPLFLLKIYFFFKLFVKLYIISNFSGLSPISEIFLLIILTSSLVSFK